MNRFARASLCGLFVAFQVEVLVVVSGLILAGVDGALVPAVLCPLLSVPAGVCCFVMTLATEKD